LTSWKSGPESRVRVRYRHRGAGEILTDWVNQDLIDGVAKRQAINCGDSLPPAWQIGLDEEFIAGATEPADSDRSADQHLCARA